MIHFHMISDQADYIPTDDLIDAGMHRALAGFFTKAFRALIRAQRHVSARQNLPKINFHRAAEPAHGAEQ